MHQLKIVVYRPWQQQLQRIFYLLFALNHNTKIQLFSESLHRILRLSPNAPPLPTAEEWGAKGKHSDAFKAKMKDLNAKLPRTFQIPTPVGNYAPDWAIAMKMNDVKHIFFVTETKGSMSSMDLSAIERAKIDCAEKLFNSISTANVKYHKVATYQDLIDGMNAIS